MLSLKERLVRILTGPAEAVRPIESVGAIMVETTGRDQAILQMVEILSKKTSGKGSLSWVTPRLRATSRRSIRAKES